METMEVEVYSQATNAAIVRMPGRQFPGLVLQGDTLNILRAHAEHVVESLRGSGEATDAAEYLATHLSELLTHYSRVLKAHSMRLPF